VANGRVASSGTTFGCASATEFCTRPHGPPDSREPLHEHPQHHQYGETNAAARIDGPHRRSTETKSALKTTEFFVYLATVIAIIVTAAVVGASDGSGKDPFGAFQALQLITFASIGYLVARGLAKSGSHEHYDA
jgi:hypothetical protein